MANRKINNALEEAEKLVVGLKAFKGTTAEHLGFLNQTEKVCTEIKEPFDFVARLLEELALTGALYSMSRIGVQDKIATNGSSISAEALATAVNVEISAISRLMRVLLVKGIATETAPDEYTHNTLSEAFLARNQMVPCSCLAWTSVNHLLPCQSTSSRTNRKIYKISRSRRSHSRWVRRRCRTTRC